MEIRKTEIDGVLVMEPKVFGDSRGYFFESFSQRDFEAQTGIHCEFVQDNESYSTKGVLRGMHFQRPPYSQAKIVRCAEGRILDVCIDLRRDSPTFGKHFQIELSGENHLQLYIPKGFAHGFQVLSDTALFQYKCDEYYHPEAEDGIQPLDPALGIDWPIKEAALSEKDRMRHTLDEIVNPF